MNYYRIGFYALLVLVGILLAGWITTCNRKTCDTQTVGTETKVTPVKDSGISQPKLIFPDSSVWVNKPVLSPKVKIGGKIYDSTVVKPNKDTYSYDNTHLKKDTSKEINLSLYVPRSVYDSLFALYSTKSYYNDSIPFKDSLGYALLRYAVQANRLENLGYNVSINKTTTTQTIEKIKRLQLYTGLQISNTYVAPALTLLTRKGALFSVFGGVDYRTRNLMLGGGLQVLITTKK